MTDRAASMPLRSRLWGSAYLLLAFTALFWAGNSVVGRAAADLVPPAALAFWRWALALALLLPVAWGALRRDLALLRAGWRMTVVLAALGVGAFNLLLYAALQHTTALNSLLVQSAQPALILLLGVFLFRDRTGVAQVAGVAVAVAGVVTIVAKGSPAVLASLDLNHGDALMLVAVGCWSLYSVLLRKRPQVAPLSFLAATIALGLLMIAPFYAAELARGARIVPEAGAFAAIAYVGLFPSLIAYAFFNRGVELIGSAAAGQFLNLMPVFGALLAMAFLGERLAWYHGLGIALIAAGIWLSTRARAEPA